MDVMILTGAGQIGMAIARRMGYGMKIVIGDKRMENAAQIADIMNAKVAAVKTWLHRARQTLREALELAKS